MTTDQPRGGQPERVGDILARLAAGISDMLPDGFTAEFDTTSLLGPATTVEKLKAHARAAAEPPTTAVDITEAINEVYRLIHQDEPLPRLARIHLGEQAFRWLRERLAAHVDRDAPPHPLSSMWGVPIVVDDTIGEWVWRLLDSYGQPIREGCILGDQILVIDTRAIRDAAERVVIDAPEPRPLPPYRRGWFR